MAWHYVYDTASGRLLSESSEVPDAAKVTELGATVLGRETRATIAEMWDPATKVFIARPAKVLADRISDITSQPSWPAINAQLTPALRTSLRDLMIEVLGTRRWRNTSVNWKL